MKKTRPGRRRLNSPPSPPAISTSTCFGPQPHHPPILLNLQKTAGKGGVLQNPAPVTLPVLAYATLHISKASSDATNTFIKRRAVPRDDGSRRQGAAILKAWRVARHCCSTVHTRGAVAGATLGGGVEIRRARSGAAYSCVLSFTCIIPVEVARGRAFNPGCATGEGGTRQSSAVYGVYTQQPPQPPRQT